MNISQETYYKELHKRDYSVYDSKNKEKLDLEELHEHSYMIFDEDESFQLYAEYEHALKEELYADIEHAKKELQNMANVFERKKQESKQLLDFWETDGEDYPY